jgi:hypothetical protein
MVYLDETSKHLIAEARGAPARFDYEYQRTFSPQKRIHGYGWVIVVPAEVVNVPRHWRLE